MVQLQRLRDTLSPSLRSSLYYLVYWGVVGVYLPFINVYFVRLGLTGSEIGMLSALFPLMMLLIAPLVSMFADRRGQRVRILTIALAGSALSFLLLGIPRTFWGLIVPMALMAMFRGPTAPIGDSLIVRMAGRRGLDYGRLRQWGSLSFALIAMVCGAIWQQIGFETMFFWTAVLYVPVVLFAALLEEEPAPEQRERRPLGEVVRSPAIVILIVTSFLVGASLQMNVVFGSVYIDYLGGTETMVGMLMGISALSEMPAMRYSGALARRLSGPMVLLLAYATLGVSYLGFVFAQDPWVLIVAGAVKGAGFALYFIGTLQLVNERAPDEWAVTVQSIVSAGSWGLAPLIASPISGAIYDTLGPTAVFIACVVLVVLAGLTMGIALLRGIFEAPAGRRRRPTVHA